MGAEPAAHVLIIVRLRVAATGLNDHPFLRRPALHAAPLPVIREACGPPCRLRALLCPRHHCHLPVPRTPPPSHPCPDRPAHQSKHPPPCHNSANTQHGHARRVDRILRVGFRSLLALHHELLGIVVQAVLQRSGWLRGEVVVVGRIPAHRRRIAACKVALAQQVVPLEALGGVHTPVPATGDAGESATVSPAPRMCESRACQLKAQCNAMRGIPAAHAVVVSHVESVLEIACVELLCDVGADHAQQLGDGGHVQLGPHLQVARRRGHSVLDVRVAAEQETLRERMELVVGQVGALGAAQRRDALQRIAPEGDERELLERHCKAHWQPTQLIAPQFEHLQRSKVVARALFDLGDFVLLQQQHLQARQPLERAPQNHLPQRASEWSWPWQHPTRVPSLSHSGDHGHVFGQARTPGVANNLAWHIRNHP
eukprot:1233868-Rhodomonas_salina.1